jgi:uncharacterized protein (TIGR03435 family)
MGIPLAAIFLAGCLFGQEFEVATVKLSNPRDGIDMQVAPDGRLTITNFHLTQLIERAYGVENYQVSGGPVWASQDKFSIIATPPDSSPVSKFSPAKRRDPPPPEELLMFQALLADRFHLKLHRETKEGTVYALVVSAKGPKLQPVKNPDNPASVGVAFDGELNGPRIYYLFGLNATAAALVKELAHDLHRPVTDETGLTTNFDFKVNFDDDETSSSLITAIQQLGLKLEARKAPMEMLVIDHAEKPSAN